jgi:hypothetical protein
MHWARSRMNFSGAAQYYKVFYKKAGVEEV